MGNTAWKDMERRVASRFGGKRVPLSGSMSGHGTGADVMCQSVLPGFFIECKLRSSFHHHAIFRRVKDMAKREGRKPLLVTHVKNEPGELVVLALDDFLELLGMG